VDVKLVNPFIESFHAVMPQLGFVNIGLGKLSSKANEVTGTGVIVVLGLVGELRGNVVYRMQMESAKKIASTMMMGMPVDEFDEIAGSALAELTNMLTANAATCFSNIGIRIDISTPTMLSGENMSVKMSSDQILCVELVADEIPVEINISFEK
jgi:chemotaxis protein CheX